MSKFGETLRQLREAQNLGLRETASMSQNSRPADILAHAYLRIDNEIIWDINQNKVQPLKDKAQPFLDQEM